jgi:rfaE bifunctional protein kinase chain/domain/rfaE bifunctional protein nucleotidyltransferase chain/domain
MKKIIQIKALKKIVSKLKTKGKKVVLCHGVFDLLHIGHINHFKEAKIFGDVLVVSLTSDLFVNKGPQRPAFNENLRVQAIAALDVVDYVVLNSTPTAVNIIRQLRPNIYCKGPDYKNHHNDITGQIREETKEIKKIRGKIIFTESTTFSSSKLINQHVNLSPAKQKKLVIKIKKNYTFSQIKKLIDDFKKLKVLIIGETIIDEYVFCEALGKSGKEPVLVLRDLNTEEYLGGAAALSRHISPFCNKVSLLSMVGEKGDYLNKIKRKLPKNVNFKYIKKKNSPTILKRRFLDNLNKNKILGVYKINDEILSKKQDKLFHNILKNMIPKHDLVIVSDYGHGFISNQSANLICKLSKYLALNAQVNAANVGYHSMRNYKSLDCVIINNREIHHEMRDRNTKTEFLMKKLSFQQKIDNLIVTRGSEGALLYNKKDNKFNISEAFARNVIDKIGAGDAMLSIIALCLKNGFKKDLALLLGSLAAAQSTETVGNKETVDKTKILKTLEHILR